jgi:hypothetical protein
MNIEKDEDKQPYVFEELILLLEDIRDGKADRLNIAKAFYTLAIEIRDNYKSLDRLSDIVHGVED